MDEKTDNILYLPKPKRKLSNRAATASNYELDLRTWKMAEKIDELLHTVEIHEKCIALLIEKIKKLESTKTPS